MSFTTWRKEIKLARVDNEDFASLMVSTLTEEELDIGFDSGYGRVNGDLFTAWTDDFVYFPVKYDGAESCGSVARNPNGNPTYRQGGG